jgi:hypothetical protein
MKRFVVVAVMVLAAVFASAQTYTITPFLQAKDLGYSYIQWMSEVGNVVWGNGGVCCPGIGTGVGECVFSVDYNLTPPRFREWWCTYRDSSQLWESGSVQVAQSDSLKWVAAGIMTYRPANSALQNDFREGPVWGFGVTDLYANGWQGVNNIGKMLRMTDTQLFPQGILDLNGARWLYVRSLAKNGATYSLMRFYWPYAFHTADWDPTTILSTNAPGSDGIAIDSDGTLIALVGGPQTATSVHLWRSGNEGRTWADTGIHFDARPGKTLFQCGFEHGSGGAAVQPLHLICVEGTGKGPDQNPPDWNAVDIRTGVVNLPASWGQAPARWK